MRYSKQREAIWNYLKERIDHPTADQIYENVRKNATEYQSGYCIQKFDAVKRYR